MKHIIRITPLRSKFPANPNFRRRRRSATTSPLSHKASHVAPTRCARHVNTVVMSSCALGALLFPDEIRARNCPPFLRNTEETNDRSETVKILPLLPNHKVKFGFQQGSIRQSTRIEIMNMAKSFTSSLIECRLFSDHCSKYAKI